MEGQNANAFTTDYLNYMLQGNRKQCSTIAKNYLDQNPSLMDLYEEVFKPALYEVGKLWENNQISVAVEHMSTAITEGILNELFVLISPEKNYNKKVVVTCVLEEEHQVGIKMVADVFEMQGWESFFLGTGIPLNELIRYIKELEPDVLAISLSIYYNHRNLQIMLEAIQQEFPELLILLGGQAISQIGKANIQETRYLKVIPDLYILEKLIKSINSQMSIIKS